MTATVQATVPPREPASGIPGLSSEEAAAQLLVDGPNLLPGNEPQSFTRMAMGVVREPMFLMLLAAGAGYLVLGDTAEATFLLASVFLIVALTIFQEQKTQRALEALRDLSAPRALVLRDGKELRIASREVVRGDVLLVREGDRIAADAALLEGALEADESLLTGESVPRAKLPHPQNGHSPDADGDGESGASLYAGTVITQGSGLARVHATAGHTAMGRIGLALATTQAPASRLYRQSRRIVRGFAGAGLVVAALLVLLAWLRDGQSFVASLLPAIAFAMAVLPEEIPVVLAVFLALGAWRLSRQKILTRRVDAIEVLGAITVLAVDKTGTLTLNRMELVELVGASAVFKAGSDTPLPAVLTELVECAMLATPLKPFDPMEKAIRAVGNARLAPDSRARLGAEPVRLYPLTPQLLAVTHVYESDTPGQHFLASKGAPETIMGLCRLEAHRRELVQQQVQDMAARGLRVLGVACGGWEGAELPDSQQNLTLRFVGLLGLADPLRPTVPQAVQDCREAGIRVIMMTGDHPVTAGAIARQAGLANPTDVLTGADIDDMDDAQLRVRLRSASICARLRPEQKLRLVRALQADGCTVGMTGDGVNDAPALKAADAGIAMGERGTDVAREAAALVLLDDSFASIATAIRQGRHVDDNIRSAVRFIFAVHTPIVALALIPALLRWPVLLLPAQIILLELIIDPACSILFEAQPADPKLMQRPPRPATDSPFALRNMTYGLLQGFGLAMALLAANWYMLDQGWHVAEIRTTLFVSLVAGLFLLVLVHRHSVNILKNPWLPRLAVAVAVLLSLVLWLPWLRGVMGFVAPSERGATGLLLILAVVTLWLLALRYLSAALQGTTEGKRLRQSGLP